MALNSHNPILNEHFRKQWMRRVKTNFNQPARKLRRSNARKNKAAAVAPRPAQNLRPIVQCQTARYNMFSRLGKGFSLAEVKAAGLNKKEARQFGIMVDHRRRNLSVEGKERNVARLMEYKEKLIRFPVNANKPKKADSTTEEISTAMQVKISDSIPPKAKGCLEKARVPTDQEKKCSVFNSLRQERRKLRITKKRVAAE